jgi:multicomponent Na+:H+ antiporter subunit G
MALVVLGGPMDPREVLSAVLLVAGAFFFLAGTAGIIRFPELHSRLHALTKADNLGLGLTVLGLLAIAPSAAVAVKLLLTWVLALLASASAASIIAERRLRSMETDGAVLPERPRR